MKFEVKKVFVFLPLIAALTACGGGGSDGGSVNANQGTTGGTTTGGTIGGSTGGSTGGATTGGTTGGTTTGGSTGGTTTGGSTLTEVKETPAGSSGSVSAPFVKNSSTRYLLLGFTELDTGVVGSLVTQQADGAIVAIDDNRLAGDLAVQSIAGDATFAMGRWGQGTANFSVRTSLVTRTDGGFHYIVFNRADTFPTSGTYTCDAGTFTAPTRSTGVGDIIGTATGSATLSFAPGGATAKVTILVQANGDQKSMSFNTDEPLATPDSRVKSLTFSIIGDGAMLTIGAAPDNKLRVVAGYQVPVGRGDYRGIATFTCAP
ncbi:hypothetical protein PV762_25980 [Mitsuaria sp. CC2]|uniref:hypothetical protein n=1 Tax=Mitsuaria sp. CC2 TaxID=3029186 RepID=UPI003B8D3242